VTDPRDSTVTGALDAQPEVLTLPTPRPREGGRLHLLRRRIEGVSLLARLVSVLVVLLLLALTVTALGFLTQLRGTMTGQIDDRLRQDIVPVSSRALDAVPGATPPARRGEGNFPSPYVTLIQYADGTAAYSPQRALFASGLPSVDPDFPSVTGEELAELGRRGNLELITVGSVGGSTRWRVGVKALYSRTTGEVAGSFAMATPLTGVDAAVARLRFVIIIVIMGVTAAGGLFGWAAIRRSFRPLVEVEETAAAIAAGDLSRRIPERPATTEVGRLTRSLNGMLTQIESAFRAREASEARTRRFAADASHELRTPLVSIRGFAELYRQGAVPIDEVPRTMRRIEDEAKRMGSLVEDLLLLARLDAQRPARSEPVDLAVLAGDAVHDARGLDAARTVRLVGLDPRGPEPAVVIGDEDRLRQVVANLVANAVRHTPDGTPIEVAVGREGTAAVLEVRDHGLGLTPEQAQRVFERFYRVDSSRRRDTGGGSGLGLSIVAAVVTAHGGSVQVLATPGGGGTFRVLLPLRAQAAELSPESPPGEPGSGYTRPGQAQPGHSQPWYAHDGQTATFPAAGPAGSGGTWPGVPSSLPMR